MTIYQSVSNLLNQYQDKEKLTWHNQTIPDDEIWLKIGRDHRGDSFKLVLEVAEVDDPNSKDNIFLIRMVECKDINENLRKILDPMKDQIHALGAMTWNDKNLTVFLFGDYDVKRTGFLEPKVFIHVFGVRSLKSKHRSLQQNNQYYQKEHRRASKMTSDNTKEQEVNRRR